MSKLSKIAVCAIAVLAMNTAAAADTKPGWARTPAPEKVAAAYSGKTEIWNGKCNGGIYYSPNNQARVWCENTPNSLGVGTWSVNAQGQMCYQMNWHWKSGSNTGASQGEKTCVSHIADPLGGLLRSWPNDPEWWPMWRGAVPTRGYKFQAQVEQARERIGF